MKKFLSLFLVLSMSMTTWAATSSVPSQAPDVMLQAFYWDSYPGGAGKAYGDTGWKTLLKDSVELGEYFDLVWLPPTANGEGTGYIPRQYSNLNSAFGSEADLRLLIGSLKRRNSRAIADIVINHCGNRSSNCDFYTMDFGTYGSFTPDNTWVTTDDEGNCGGGSHADKGYDGEQNYGAARDWDHQNTNVQAMCRAYLQWMKAQGYDGWRYDYCKGFTHDHINDYNTAAGAYISVMEYWDGNSDVLQSRLNDASWNTMVFDFSTKYNALNDGICAFDYSKCKGAGLPGAGKSKYAVTFIDNHDTFTRNESEFGGINNSMTDLLKDRLLQANAFILAMPGIPCVFYPHWVTHKDAIKKMIEARHMTGVHSESVVKDEYAEKGGYQATIVGKNGYIVLQLGNKASGTIDGFTKYASGNGYAIWTYVKETEYYMKNNWGGGNDWTWKKMTAAGDGTYKLENVVFGGTGVNYNTSDSDEGNTWVALAAFKGDAISAGDKVTFTLNPTAGTVTAKKVEAGGSGGEPGGGDEPAETMTVYFVNVPSWSAVKAFVWPAEGSAYKEWPGEAMTKEDEKINGYDVYSYTFAKTYVNIIFNNGDGTQTADLTWSADKPYFYPTDKTDGKYSTAWYAKASIPTSGDEPGGGDEPAETMTVYFVNVPSWSAVKAFVWPAEGNAYKEWPGEAMTKEDEKINGYDVYSYTFAKTYVNIIFNNGDGTQTADLTWSADKPYFYPTEKTANKYSTAWYAKANIPTSGDQPGGGDEPAETMTVYFVNVPSWSAVKAFVWPAEGNAYKEWPGEAMTKEDEKINGYDVYSYTFAKTYANIIFNNGDGTQTADLTWSADKPYFYPTEKTANKYSTAWYAKASIPTSGDQPGGGDEPAETMTVYFVNVPSWSAVKAFVWPAEGSAYKEWPGEAMTKEDEKINGYDVYSYTFAKTYVNIIFNNGDGTQTADLTWSADKPYFYPTEKTANKYSTAWYAKANIPTSGDQPGGGDNPEQPTAKFYITGDSALVVDAGLTKDFAWNPAAIKSVKDTMELDLKADQYYVLKVTMNGTWVGENNVKGYNELTEKTAGLDDVSNDHNIGFKLSKAGKVQVIYTVKEGETIFKLVGEFVTSGDQPGGGDDPEQPAAKFYITGDSALVVDAGLTKDFAWNPAAIKSVKDTMELDLKADQYYVLKVTMNGTWVGENNVKGYNELTEKAAGLDDVSNDHNIGFKLSKAGKVQVIYTVKEGETIFKLVGGFVTSGDQPGGGDEPAETMTVYYVNTERWASVNAYVWKDDDHNYKSWPGSAMTKTDKTANGKEVYSFTFPAEHVNIIFNNGSAQTGNLVWEKDKPYFYVDEWYASLDDIPSGQPVAAKFYITGDSALVVDAGLTKDFAWNPAAIKSVKDTMELDLKADQYYVLKVTMNGTWVGENNVKGYNELTEKAAGLDDVSDDHNIGFKLSKAGKVQVIYTVKEGETIFKLVGEFVTSGDQPGGGDDPEQPAAKFYITGDSALVVDAGLTKDFAWNPAAIKSVKDTMELDLKADQYYVLKVTMNGTWVGDNNVKGYNELTEKTAGLDDVSNDHNIGFKLSEAGVVKVIYTIKDNNLIFKLEGKFVVSEPVVLENGFYLAGTLNDWTPAAEYLFTVNEANPSEYLLNVTLAAGDEIKVVKVENGTITTWYPAEGGNFVVTDSYAGQKTIYFQETYNENWAAFGGFIYIEPNTATDAEAVPVEGKAVKVLRDGQLLIIRGTRIYSVTGELVR